MKFYLWPFGCQKKKKKEAGIEIRNKWLRTENITTQRSSK
jgi:hypothetical protein